MKLTADALNHLLHQNAWAAAQLRAYAGKTVRLSLPPLNSTLAIDAGGTFAPAPPGTAADAEIVMTPAAALRLLLQPQDAPGLASLAGDMELAAAVGKVLAGLRWDAEEDLSRIVGDIPAHELSRAGGAIRHEIARQARALADMLAEYWLEEHPLLAKKRHLQQFAHEVDTLRDDVERLEKRLQRLEHRS